MASRKGPLHLFEATGLELEYMIVDRDTLAVSPIADELLKSVAGRYDMEVERGDIAWSNELALHVVELKTNGPVLRLQGVAERFQANVQEVNALLAPLGARLMPSGMHPWMDPYAEMRLWPHEDNPIYRAFDRIFDCRGHGWANLQSAHINLPFANDGEFGRLHAAIRLLLPIVPALAASSPVVGGRVTGLLDNRLEAYRHNASRVPSVSGAVIPEPLYTREAYETQLLGRIYADLAPHDPEGILRYEWVNARGAIARFDRGSIEIRLLDVQECPLADVAVAAAIVAAVRALVEGRLSPLDLQQRWPVEPLAELWLAIVRDGGAAMVHDAAYRAALGYAGGPCTAGELWQHLVRTTLDTAGEAREWSDALDLLLTDGCLSRRILAALGASPDQGRLSAVYGQLCECLASGRMFRPADLPS